MSDDPAPSERLKAARHRRLIRMAGALLLGAAGGYVFKLIQAPLPFMLGSMTFCTIAALAKAPIASPIAIRPPMLAILGVMLGASFSPDVIAGIVQWAPTMLGVVAYVLVSGTACTFFLKRFAGFDFATAYFAGMPGGLAEMMVQSEAQGADSRSVALIHAFRILITVMTLPLVVQALGHMTIGPRTATGVSMFDVPASGYLWLTATSSIGAALGYLLRLPAGYLLGPVIVSSVVHVLGWSDFKPPRELINVAQIVIGAGIGCRFIGGSLREIGRVAVAALGSTLILMGSTFGLALLLAQVTDHALISLILAYAPGGLAEMSLVALALGIEVPFVAAHHIARLLLVLAGAPTFFRMMNRR